MAEALRHRGFLSAVSAAASAALVAGVAWGAFQGRVAVLEDRARNAEATERLVRDRLDRIDTALAELRAEVKADLGWIKDALRNRR